MSEELKDYIASLPSGTPAGGDTVPFLTAGGVLKQANAGSIGGGEGLHVESYGAVGDGTTNDTAAIQAALDAFALSDEKILNFDGSKSYKITTALVKTLTDKVVRGNGAEIFCSTLASGSAMWNADASIRSIFEGLRFRGPAKNSSNYAGIDLATSTWCHVRDCHFTLLTTGAGSSVGLTAVYNRFYNNLAEFCWYGFIPAEYAALSNNTSRGCEYGAYFPAGNFRAVNNDFGNNRIGALIDGRFSTNSDHSTFANNTCNHCDSCGLYLQHINVSIDVVGNQIWAAGLGFVGSPVPLGSAPADSTFGVYIENSVFVGLVGNSISHSNGTNVGINGMTKSRIANNTFLSDVARTYNSVKEVGGTNSSYLFIGNVSETALAGSGSVVLATDMPGATIPAGTNLLV